MATSIPIAEARSRHLTYRSYSSASLLAHASANARDVGLISVVEHELNLAFATDYLDDETLNRMTPPPIARFLSGIGADLRFPF